MLNLNSEQMKDHDLLTTINSKIDNILEKLIDHEKRIRWIERIGIIGLTGYILVKEVLLKFLA